MVADPSEDLTAAAVEGGLVREALGPARARLLRGAVATRSAILAALPRVDLFHYAGHASFGGPEGMQGGLGAAAGSRILLGDILALDAGPRLVVLSACEGARESAAGVAAGLSLAQAFLAAGAEAVVAAPRAVEDQTARTLVERFYRHLGGAASGGGGGDASQALRQAQRELLDRPGGSAAASFRVMVP